MNILLAHIKLVQLASVRQKSLPIFLLFAILSCVLSVVVGAASGRQPQTMTYDIGFSLCRILLPVFGIFWLLEQVAKDIDKKVVAWICAAPLARAQYILGRWLGILLLQVFAGLFLAGLLYFSVKVVAPNYHQPTPIKDGIAFFLPFASLFLDVMVISAFCLLMCVVATSTAMPLFMSILFLIICRSLGPTVAYLKFNTTVASSFSRLLDSLLWILPDLSRLDIRSLVLYGEQPMVTSLLIAGVQSVSYAFVLVFVACQVFKRREFV